MPTTGLSYSSGPVRLAGDAAVRGPAEPSWCPATSPTAAAGGRITAIPTPGHTPGHQSVLVEGDLGPIVITGDVLVHAVQLADPDVAYRFEADPETARHSRHALLARARTDGAVLATAHLTEPFVRPR